MFEQATPLTKRINELAKKAKTVGLTEAEKEEQTLLRQEFLIKFRANFKTQVFLFGKRNNKNLKIF